MRTYTFKIKLFNPSEKHPIVLSVVHCPLEVLFDSLKEVKQFEELYKLIGNTSDKEFSKFYITASDYETNGGVDYIYNDYILCEYTAIIESKSLTELLTHKDYYDFVDSYLDIRNEQDELALYYYKEGEQNEV